VNVKVDKLTIEGEALPTGAELVALVNTTPKMVLMKPSIFAPFMAEVRAKIAAAPLDITTKKGRDARISLAADVTTTKTAIEKAKLALTADMRAAVTKMNETASEFVEELAALAKETRRPVTEWEEADKARKARVDTLFAELDAAAIIPRDATSDDVMATYEDIREMDLPPAIFQDRLEEATKTREKVLFTLSEAYARIVQEEADRAELAKLRAEQAAREQEKASLAAAEKAEAKRKADAEAAEARRLAAEQAEADRIAAAEKRAKEQAEWEAQKRADEALAAAERAHQAELERVRREAAEAELERRREADRQAAAAKKAAEDDARRAANKRHRERIVREVEAGLLKAFEGFGISDPPALATRLAAAIVNGDVQHTLIQF